MGCGRGYRMFIAGACLFLLLSPALHALIVYFVCHNIFLRLLNAVGCRSVVVPTDFHI
jgi:hypothetical protein